MRFIYLFFLNIKKTLQTRHFVLRGNCAYYFKNAKDSHPKGVIELTSDSVLSNSDIEQFAFTIQTPGRVWILSCETGMERERWMRAIDSAIPRPGCSNSSTSLGDLNRLVNANKLAERARQAVREQSEINKKGRIYFLKQRFLSFHMTFSVFSYLDLDIRFIDLRLFVLACTFFFFLSSKFPIVDFFCFACRNVSYSCYRSKKSVSQRMARCFGSLCCDQHWHKLSSNKDNSKSQ